MLCLVIKLTSWLLRFGRKNPKNLWHNSHVTSCWMVLWSASCLLSNDHRYHKKVHIVHLAIWNGKQITKDMKILAVCLPWLPTERTTRYLLSCGSIMTARFPCQKGWEVNSGPCDFAAEESPSCSSFSTTWVTALAAEPKKVAGIMFSQTFCEVRPYRRTGQCLAMLPQGPHWPHSQCRSIGLMI